ncbi:ABC-three component system middle component 5 [Xanthobacter tagetidis]|uniref:ABC-three component system middle component 5 n=1 Tax=Xanthobacter tagetidis TaxID=60216 RepID=UPI0011C472AD|nr:ABC-three component system middle component 5 [Xanthobacter tagetidis]MBB6308882.1 hypothetical protein [Xanthobacter tagetidis]
MKVRQWYAQLDVFDTVRRYTALMSRWSGEGPTRERLFVSDFYLANPSLLHETNMTSDARKAFNELRVPRPDQIFLRLPSAAVLYQKMSGIQSEALHNMLGRGLCDLRIADSGQFRLSEDGQRFARSLGRKLVLPLESEVADFLTSEFRMVGVGRGGLRAATGLMRIGT